MVFIMSKRFFAEKDKEELRIFKDQEKLEKDNTVKVWKLRLIAYPLPLLQLKYEGNYYYYYYWKTINNFHLFIYFL